MKPTRWYKGHRYRTDRESRAFWRKELVRYSGGQSRSKRSDANSIRDVYMDCPYDEVPRIPRSLRAYWDACPEALRRGGKFFSVETLIGVTRPKQTTQRRLWKALSRLGWGM